MTELLFDQNEDWNKRILCSDESCIGTIGDDGRCKECGKPYNDSINTTVRIVDENNAQIQLTETLSNQTESIVTDEEWDKRVLCGDESCIGTIGPDGKCRECGEINKQHQLE